MRFVKLGTKPIRAKRILSRDGTVVVELESGAFWSNRINGRYAYTPGRFSDTLLRLLVDFGRLPKSAWTEHQAHVARCEAGQKKRDERSRFLSLVRTGLKPTKAQIKRYGISGYELANASPKPAGE